MLDVGAGTGRVALALARAGHDVTALDREPELLEALAARAQAAGARAWRARSPTPADFALDRRFGLIVVPMQTIQLLPERAGFLAAARPGTCSPGGLLGVAITAALEDFGDLEGELPDPDTGRGGRLALRLPADRRAGAAGGDADRAAADRRSRPTAP